MKLLAHALRFYRFVVDLLKGWVGRLIRSRAWVWSRTKIGSFVSRRKCQIMGLPYSLDSVKRHTPEQRAESYVNRSHMITWVGVGLAASIALAGGAFSAALLSCAPSALKALMVTLIALSGTCFAMARVKFEREARKLLVNWPKGSVAWRRFRPWQNQDTGGWPTRAERYWNYGRWLFVLAGLCYITGAWWGVSS